MSSQSNNVELSPGPDAATAGSAKLVSSTNNDTRKRSTFSKLMEGEHHHVVMTEHCGSLNVILEGDIEAVHKDMDSKCVFLTVHDVGNNHQIFQNFMHLPAFEDMLKRSVVVHVIMPGHEEGSDDLVSYVPEGLIATVPAFPTIQHLGEDLVTVLNQLRLKQVIGLGIGAGANILARFGMMHRSRCLGLILLQPTSNKQTMAQTLKDRFNKVKPTGENLLIFRKFGHKMKDDGVEQQLESFKKHIGANLNMKNVALYIESYDARNDITSQLSSNLNCDCLMVVGSNSPTLLAAEHMYQNMNKTRSSLLKIDGVGNVLDEAPLKLINSILLFCKGLGMMSSVTLPGVTRRCSAENRSNWTVRQKSISMEEYDRPNIRRLSITSHDKK